MKNSCSMPTGILCSRACIRYVADHLEIDTLSFAFSDRWKIFRQRTNSRLVASSARAFVRDTLSDTSLFTPWPALVHLATLVLVWRLVKLLNLPWEKIFIFVAALLTSSSPDRVPCFTPACEIPLHSGSVFAQVTNENKTSKWPVPISLCVLFFGFRLHQLIWPNVESVAWNYSCGTALFSDFPTKLSSRPPISRWNFPVT